MSKERILVVEDQPDISGLLKIYFTSQGYDVMTASRGQQAIEICRKTPPNLALLDINLPDMLGYDIGRELRASPRTKHIPIIFLTALGEKQNMMTAFGEINADDYIVKPFDIEIVHQKVRINLDKARMKNQAHPVTNLPTAELIGEELRRLLSAEGWALSMIHINGFDTFTQAYGAVVGEDVLKFSALLINEVINELGSTQDFVGQLVTGPDFLVVSTPDKIRPITERITERFDQEIGLHYSYRDRKNGYITITDDSGASKQMPLMSVSVGVLTSADGPFYDIRELSETAESVRQAANTQPRAEGMRSAIKFGR